MVSRKLAISQMNLIVVPTFPATDVSLMTAPDLSHVMAVATTSFADFVTISTSEVWQCALSASPRKPKVWRRSVVRSSKALILEVQWAAVIILENVKFELKYFGWDQCDFIAPA